MQEGSSKAIVAALIANFGICCAKFVGFMVTGASSMMAEAVHSLADTGNQALLLWGGKAARKKATADHPFGYGRERYFWSFVVAQVIFALGALFAIYEGVEKLRHPHPLESPIWAVGILAFAILLEGYSFMTAIKEGKKAKGTASWRNFIKHTKKPELPVVLLEDLGAMVGLVVALIGITLAMVTGNARFDAMGSIAIGILLGAISVVLAIEMKSLLIGEGVTSAQEKTIKTTVEGTERVNRLIHMRTLYIGPDELLVAMKVELIQGLSGIDVASIINTLETNIRAALPEARMIYVEPDIFQEGRTDKVYPS